jgi:AP-1 complex subunit gamma-1
VATNTESLKNAGNAVLYELVNCVMAIESEAGLKALAVTTLGKFLASKDPNLKCVPQGWGRGGGEV